MKANRFPNDPGGVFCAFELPKFGLTWVGANPFGEGFCVGSESGKIVLVSAEFQARSQELPASAAGEPVNSVAFSQHWLAVTTRKDINFIGPFTEPKRPPEIVSFSGGGRDVIVAPTSGQFVISLGPDGVMFVKPGIGENDPVTISKSDKSGLNFCRALALPGERGNDVLVCAGRRGGIGYTEYREGIRGHTLHTATFNDLDLVDVCSVATPEKPLAVVAAAKDGSMVLFDNILTDKTPKTIKFNGVKGTVYRILSTQGDIYLLTSKGLFGLFHLATRFLDGGRLRRSNTDILRLPIAAADANLVGQKWLLAAEDDILLRFDLEKMPKSPGNGALAHKDDSREEPVQIMTQPQWDESSFEQTSANLAGAV